MPPAVLLDLRAHLAAALPAYLRDLEQLVNIDSGTHWKPGVDAVARWTAARLRALGADVRVLPHDTLGDTVTGTFRGAGGPALVLLGHLDTVFPPGTAAARPFRLTGGVARGPGVSDMKGGLLAGLYALEALIAHVGGPDRLPFRRLLLLATPDEEIGAPASAPHLSAAATGADAALVLEAARADGAIVSSRKGVLDLVVRVCASEGPGAEDDDPPNPIPTAARLVEALHALPARVADVTLNVGVIRGDARPLARPVSCTLELEVRSTRRVALDAAEHEIRALAAGHGTPAVSIEIDQVSRIEPMERSPSSDRLIAHASAIGRELGFDVRDTSTGGASDANLLAGLGVPTLDGLGPIGGLDHSPDEYLDVTTVVPRTTLLAGLLLAVAADGPNPALRPLSGSKEGR